MIEPTTTAPANAGALSSLEAACLSCKRCGLCQTRTKVVFGSGNPHADVMLVGEAPGKNEDEQGYPFVGRAGMVLDELLAVMGLERGDIYIANVLKCRPPQNRDPQMPEIAACEPWLAGQMTYIEPKVIVTLGNYATQWSMPVAEGISRTHGKLFERHSIGGTQVSWGDGTAYVFPSFHPAAALYDSTKMPQLTTDFARLGNWLKANGQE